MGYLLNYDYIKKHYRLIAVDLSRQKELEADPKLTQQTKFVRQSKNVDGMYADGTQNMFYFNIIIIIIIII